MIDDAWRPVIPLAAAVLGYGIATALGGSGFIAAFVGGALFGLLAGGKLAGMMGFTEQAGAALDSVWEGTGRPRPLPDPGGHSLGPWRL